MNEIGTIERLLISMLEKVPDVSKTYGIKDNEYIELINLLLSDNLWEGVNSYLHPIKIPYVIPSVNGAAGSGNPIESGISFSTITTSDPNYPDTNGIIVTFKKDNSRGFQLFVGATESKVWSRFLHSSVAYDWELLGADLSNYVVNTLTITAGTGLTGGGNLSANRTISFDSTWGDARYYTKTLANASFMLRSSVARGVDPNTIKTSSAYRVNSHANLPTNTIYALLTYGNDTNVVSQIASRVGTGETYIRSFNTVWSSWVQIGVSSGGDVTQAGVNAFTGANSFTAPPTSEVNAETEAQLVRLGQITPVVANIEGRLQTLEGATGVSVYNSNGVGGILDDTPIEASTRVVSLSSYSGVTGLLSFIGKQITLSNRGVSDMIVYHEDVNSLPANQFSFEDGLDIVLAPNQSILLTNLNGKYRKADKLSGSGLNATSANFTPVLVGQGLTFTYTSQIARIEKIGKVCTIFISINFSATGTPTGGGLKIDGLPINFRGISNMAQRVPVLQMQNSGYTNDQVSRLAMEIDGNIAQVEIVFVNQSIAQLTTYTSCSLIIQGSYISD